MKIIVNYDLIDRVREAKTGFSLIKGAKTIGLSGGIVVPIRLMGAALGNDSFEEVALSLMMCGMQIVGVYGVNAIGYSKFIKRRSNDDLIKLATKLSDICVETDAELLKHSYQYDIKYNVNFESFPPKIEQTKYIMVPVNNEFGNNERSLAQEHVIGSRDYALSYGEPEKQKVYSYGTRRMISK